MKKTLFLVLLASASFAVQSCSPFQVKTDYAETANFNQYKTYVFRTDDLKLNDIDKDRVLNEIAKNLQSKGMTPSQASDLIINVKASHKKIEEMSSSSPFGMSVYGGSFGWGIGMSRTWGRYNDDYNSGTLTIDMIDAKTQKLVWQGIGSGISVDSPQSKQKEIPQIVAEIMAYYPPQKGK